MSDLIDESVMNPFISSKDRYDILAKLSEMQDTAVTSSLKELLNAQILHGSSSPKPKDQTKEEKDFKELYKEEHKEHKDGEKGKDGAKDGHKDGKDGAKDSKDGEKDGKDGKDGEKDSKDGEKDDKDGKEDPDNAASMSGNPAELKVDTMEGIGQLQTTRLNVLLKQRGVII